MDKTRFFNMNIIFKKIENTYIKIFTLSPKILSTILFIPFLYILGWLLARPIQLIGLDSSIIELLVLIFTFLLFIICLPKWFKFRWGLNNTWQLVGIKKTNRNDKLFFYLLKGFLYSILMISVILIPVIGTKWGSWLGKISPEIFLNYILLTIGVGFAEELIFRGWLLEELKIQFKLKKAIVFQALIFSLVHISFKLPIFQMISILSGLFLLGILLALIRLKDNNSLWACITLHGGLVGWWFLANNGLIEISKDAPIWLVGPGEENTNPLGGILGIILLFGFLFFYFRRFRKNYSNIN